MVVGPVDQGLADVLQRLDGEDSLFYRLRDHLILRSFPTRRSSDLRPAHGAGSRGRHQGGQRHRRGDDLPDRPPGARSEEYTSELQSLTNLVCRLLLEKKKFTRTSSSPSGLLLSLLPAHSRDDLLGD